MKFLFFDTECASCTNGAKLCEFGYVLTDEKFRIIKKNNLLINPRSRFNVYGFRRAGIQLAYSIETYKKSPSLKERYKEIKKLLTSRNVLPVGYSCDNDARFLLSDLKRNSLENFDYRFLDVFELIKTGLGREKNLSLDAVYAETGCEETVHHEAASDALMTMEVFKYFLSVKKMKVKKILNERYAFGEVFQGRIVVGDKPFSYSDSGKMTPLNKRVLAKFLNDKPVADGALANKSFCFEKVFEKDNFPFVLKAADLVTDRGGRFTEILSYADYVISPLGAKAGYVHKKKRRSARVIGVDALCRMLDVSEKEFENVDVDRILAKLPENGEWYAAYKKRKIKKFR